MPGAIMRALRLARLGSFVRDAGGLSPKPADGREQNPDKGERHADGTHGEELWKSDGTSAGTVMVADLVPGSGGSAPQQLTAVGNKLSFVAQDSAGQFQIWDFKFQTRPRSSASRRSG